MKRIFVILLSFLVASYAEGKDKDGNPYYEKGYVGNVGLNVGGTIGRYDEIGIMTVHGFSFADGFMLGGGTGILIPLEFDSKERGVSIPVFADAKYSMYDSRISPFFEGKFGLVYSTELGAGLIVSPSLGIDIGRWSVNLSYMFQAYNADRAYDSTIGRFTWTPYRYSSILVGCTWSF